MAIAYPGSSVTTYFVTLGAGVTQGTTTFNWLKTAEPLFVVVTITDSTYSCSSVTFDGVAMTASYSFTGATTSRTYTFWTLKTNLASKAAGTYNVVVTNSVANKVVDAFLVQYSGVKDDFSSLTSGQVSFVSSPITFNHTTVADDSWLFLFGIFSASLRVANGSSDGVYRMSSNSSRFIVDSGANEGTAGAKSVNCTSASGASGVVEYMLIEFKKETSMSLNVTDTATATDPPPTKAETTTKTEAAAFSDSQRKSLTKIISESQTFLEAVASLVSRIFTDTVSLTDSAFKSLAKITRDTVTLTDTLGTKTLVKRVADVINFVDLTPILDGVWIDRTKPPASWSDRTKPSSAWTDRTKPSPSWTDRTDPTTSWTERTEPTTGWS